MKVQDTRLGHHSGALALPCLFLMAAGAGACSLGAGDHVAEDYSVPAGKEEFEVTHVDLREQKQRIRGFGASSAWTAPRLSDALADEFFSVEHGLGLSLLRIQVSPDGTSHELGTVDAAVARGAAVWAAPWSPPSKWKTNGDTANGGSLLPEHFADWASSLANFALLMQERGTPLLGISAQNEPDYSSWWDTCLYSPDELARFVGDFLGPALDERKVQTRVIAPESANWDSVERFGDAILDYPKASDYTLAIATHGYGEIPPHDYERVRKAGRELWQTEVSDTKNKKADSGMVSALHVARMIHADLTVGQVSAWHYWWLLPRGDESDTNAALTDADFKLTRRAYALGHFSKFVRPGYHRVGATPNPARQVASSAYVSPDETELVIVFISDRSEPLAQEVELLGGRAKSVTLWATDQARKLEAQPERRIDGDSFSVTLPANSMVTLMIRLSSEEQADGGVLDAGSVSAL